MTSYRLQFETVSAAQHPEAYRNERAIKDKKIPEDWWHLVVTPNRTLYEATQQWKGLHDLIRSGEHIRNVKVYRTEDTFVDITDEWRT